MFDYALATEINRKRLLRIAAELVDMVGSGKTVLRHVHLYVLSILLPAEAATRRLIAVLARELVIAPRRERTPPAAPVPKGTRERLPAFLLLDRRRNVDPKEKRVPGRGPGVRGFDDVEHFPPAKPDATPNDPVSARRIRGRVLAVMGALDDLDRQARRLARAKLKWKRPMRPMRPGRPPGHRQRGKREIDEVLADCHALALLALHEAEEKPPDKGDAMAFA